MTDEDWRTAEREWERAREDQVLLERAIAARRRARVAVPLRMLEARALPARTVVVPEPFAGYLSVRRDRRDEVIGSGSGTFRLPPHARLELALPSWDTASRDELARALPLTRAIGARGLRLVNANWLDEGSLASVARERDLESLAVSVSIGSRRLTLALESVDLASLALEVQGEHPVHGLDTLSRAHALVDLSLHHVSLADGTLDELPLERLDLVEVEELTTEGLARLAHAPLSDLTVQVCPQLDLPRAIARFPSLERLHVAECSLEELSRVSSAPRLKRLVCYGTSSERADLAAFSSLETLDLSLASSLADVSGLPRTLRVLDLSMTGAVRSTLPLLDRLEELALGSHLEPHDGLDDLPRACPNLVRLRLDDRLTEEKAAALARLERLEDVAIVNGGPFSTEALGVLAKAPRLRAVKLVARMSAGDHAPLRHLGPFAERLEELTVPGMVHRLQDAERAVLERLTKLRKLRLELVHVDAPWLLAIAKLPSLEELTIHGTSTAPEGVRALSALTNLRVLELGAVELDPRELVLLVKALPRLERLVARGEAMTSRVREELYAAKPDLVLLT